MSGVITGRVIDAAGAPIAGATVAVTSNAQPVSDIASLTDADGRFRRGGLAPGRYTLDVRKAGRATRSIDVDVADAQQTNLEVRLDD